MADPCPFRNFDELIVFLANNALTGGDNQVLLDGRERSGKTTLGRIVNRYLYQYLHHDAIARSVDMDARKATRNIAHSRPEGLALLPNAPNGDLMFACGCRAGQRTLKDGRKAFALLPCRPDASCPASVLIQQETADQSKPIELVARGSMEAVLFAGAGRARYPPPRYLPEWKREWDFLNNVIFDFQDWQNIYDREEDLGQHQIDEGGNLLFSRNAMTGENKQVIQTVQMCGIRHATMTWILPNKHWMDPYIREHRATVWAHVHTSYTLNGMTRGLATWHWRQDNYMTGNVWWSDPIFWHKFEELPRDWEQAGYDAIKESKLHASTVSDPSKSTRKR